MLISMNLPSLLVCRCRRVQDFEVLHPLHVPPEPKFSAVVATSRQARVTVHGRKRRALDKVVNSASRGLSGLKMLNRQDVVLREGWVV